MRKNNWLLLIVLFGYACTPQVSESDADNPQPRVGQTDNLKTEAQNIKPLTDGEKLKYDSENETERALRIAGLEAEEEKQRLLRLQAFREYKAQEKRLFAASNIIYRNGIIDRMIENQPQSEKEKADYALIVSAYSRIKKHSFFIPEEAKVIVIKKNHDIHVLFERKEPRRPRGSSYALEIIIDTQTDELYLN